MAPVPNVNPSPEIEIFPEPKPLDRVAEPRFEIARLALLHDEARETAILANLLGRAPYAAAVLGVAAIAMLLSSAGAMPVVEQAIWVMLMLTAAGAILRAWQVAIAQPFERGPLREFARDMNAIMVFAGFAWGAGAYLALGPATSPLLLTAFAAAVPAAVALALRSREISLAFLAPVATLGAFAAVLRPLPEGPLAAAFVLIASLAVGGAIFWAGRLSAAASTPVSLPDISPA